MAEPARQLPEEDQPRTRPNQGVVQGGGEGDGQPKGNLSEAQSDPYDNSQSEQPVTRPDLRALEGGGEGDGKPKGNLNDTKSSSPGDLKDSEEEPNTEDDRVGQGYTPDDPSSTKRQRSRARITRKRALIGGSAIAGVVGTGVIGFFLLIPLKIESLVSDLQSHFFSSSDSAVQNETNSMFQEYIRDHVGLSLKTCGNTINKNCRVNITGSGAVSNLYRAW